jgi:hypothetical protein
MTWADHLRLYFSRQFPIVVGVLAATFLVSAALLKSNATLQKELTERQQLLVLEQLGDRIETRLSLGQDLREISEMQDWLEKLGLSTDLTKTLDVLDTQGTYIASTDRAGIGESQRELLELLKSARRSFDHQGRTYVVANLTGAFSQTGWLMLSYPIEPFKITQLRSWRWLFLGFGVLLIASIWRHLSYVYGLGGYLETRAKHQSEYQRIAQTATMAEGEFLALSDERVDGGKGG